MAARSGAKVPVVALAGLPNVGKSTVFNLLTGLSQHVGNWPGKTIEQKTGMMQHNGAVFQLVDLPGTYSLTANSVEEQIARDYLAKDKPDLVVAVLNAASMERGLYLVAELIELAPRLVIALNMTDVAQQEGTRVDARALEAALKIPVVPMVASRNQGVKDLAKVIAQECVEPAAPRNVKHIESGSQTEADISRVAEILTDEDTAPYPRHWTATKLLEGDEQINRMLRERIPEGRWSKIDSILKENEEAVIAIASLRFDWVRKILLSAQQRRPIGQVSFTERLDRAATHPILGLAVLVLVMGLAFGVVYGIGVPLQHFLEVSIVERIQGLVFDHMTFVPNWLQGLLSDGIIGGVGMVLTFLPILFLFFLAWGFLEDVGYTARVAFVTDRYMHALGLHGKSALPLLLGFGCNVPAVMGTRIIESRRARLLTVLLTPLIPCTGRMAVIAVIAGAVFGTWALLVTVGIIAFSLVVLAVLGLVMNRFVLRGKRAALMMELPLYHTPNPRTIGLGAWQRTAAFIKRAGTVILIVSIVVWALSYFPGEGIEESFLADIGRWLEPLGRLMGLDWEVMVALLTSFVAKENTIATLGVLLGREGTGLTQYLREMLTPAAGLAFLVAQVLFIPCVATVACIRQETGSWRWMAASIGLQLVLSFCLAILVYQVGKLVGT
ncbi:MAG: ferrous iron transport protein B [Dehalococcoidia bacterium]|nr:ferrous iron transport protein B [Dehalococcoidia bacterium]